MAGPPDTTAVLALAVPLRVTSPLVKPVTSALKVTVKLMGDALVGSAWPDACSTLSVGDGGGATLNTATASSREPAA